LIHFVVPETNMLQAQKCCGLTNVERLNQCMHKDGTASVSMIEQATF
jgi:hypothetical protein